MDMKTGILRFASVAVAVFLPLAAIGQNLDPTVEVTRTYEGKLMEVHKPQLKMDVPDSVRRFDLDFDYSVTETPYRGAYEFIPYSMDMRPSPTIRDDRSFRLRAGAGYQLHPELELLWSPELKTNVFRMGVYASHKSFFGKYWDMSTPSIDNGVVILDRLPKDAEGERTSKGYDVVNRIGVDGRVDWKKGAFTFDVGYRGLMQDSWMADKVNRFYDALEAGIGFSSKKRTGFFYDVNASYDLAGDNISILYYTQDTDDQQNVKAYELDVSASLGYVRRKGDRFVLDVGVNLADVSGVIRKHYDGYGFDLVPHYVRESGRWLFDLGLRISADNVSSRSTDVRRFSGQFVYPDVRVEWQALKNALKLYLDVGGDSEMNSYPDLLRFNRHFNPDYCRVRWELMDASVERVNAVLGVESRIGSRFSFNLRGGYVKYDDALMDGVYRTYYDQKSSAFPARLMPAAGYGDYDKVFAAFDWLLDTECVRFDGMVEYAYSWSNKPESVSGLFFPAALKGDVELVYDWNDRIFVGLDCGFSSARNGGVMYPGVGYVSTGEFETMPARLPGYADLGFSLEYAMTRSLSVWARGGNLLGMTIQRDILYAERGPYFTVGICLNL